MRPDFQECNELKIDGRINPESAAIRDKTTNNKQQTTNAVNPNHDFAQMTEMLEAFTIEFLKQKGIKLIHTISTGFNIAELNRLTQNHHFRITSSTVLLRKLIV
jgi:Tfp pilus assembly protein PilP